MTPVTNIVFEANHNAVQFSFRPGTIQFLCTGNGFVSKNVNKSVQRGCFFNAGKKVSYRLLTGGSTNPAVTGDDDQINALVDLLREQTTVGGRSPSIPQMVGLLFEMMNNPESMLGISLTGDTAGKVGEPASTQSTIANILS